MGQVHIDWVSVVSIFLIVAIPLFTARFIGRAERIARQREERELHQRAEEAFYYALDEKYKPTLTPEEVAHFNGPAWR